MSEDKNSREKLNEVRVDVARGGEERKIRTSSSAHELVHAREGGRLCDVARCSPPKDYTARRSPKKVLSVLRKAEPEMAGISAEHRAATMAEMDGRACSRHFIPLAQSRRPSQAEQAESHLASTLILMLEISMFFAEMKTPLQGGKPEPNWFRISSGPLLRDKLEGSGEIPRSAASLNLRSNVAEDEKIPS
ncbi:hypothetical protein B0H13DRAFT_1921440 [Mycena leptocephala]|nr:hypothetical protein B0H13DRAFT_1921440 [Mycena leptocephala]